MATFHIHITGRVQGVGFRPFVYRLAGKLQIRGWVCNGMDGLHIQFTSSQAKAREFYRKLVEQAPRLSIITGHHMREEKAGYYKDFRIIESSQEGNPDLLLTPDIALCPQCRVELHNTGNRRYRYPFITCTDCGPRYSITRRLPYDRSLTSMSHLRLCPACQEEYSNPDDRRYYSQTNSCHECSIPLYLFNSAGEKISSDPDSILQLAAKALKEGHILAVKGMGGYLLLADPENALAIESLRERKQRPAKPFALMYPDIEMARKDAHIRPIEQEAMESGAAPVVLCTLLETPGTGICTGLIAPGLRKIGILLPNTGLLDLIAKEFGRPLVATSGNLSGSPIIYTDEEALLWLCDVADYVLSYDREILTPEDDSVIQFSGQYNYRILLRRSRGYAPGFFPNPVDTGIPTLAMGADLKAAFAVYNRKKIYISQYLGDQSSYESQQSFRITLQHLMELLELKPERILVDKHPGYFSTQTGRMLSEKWEIPCIPIQHHRAHIAAVLAENKMYEETEPVLGIAWDGTGYGDDGQVWGGEFFLCNPYEMERIAHLAWFPQLQGDKMSREPRLSAISLIGNDMERLLKVRDLFSVPEREFYLRLLQQPQPVQCSSAGRMLDGIAAILGIAAYNSYESEATLKLEALALDCTKPVKDIYPMPVEKMQLQWHPLVAGVLADRERGKDRAWIARKVFNSLVSGIEEIAKICSVRTLAFSGGVFQNTVLVDCLHRKLAGKYRLLFHRDLSPNDECIGFGQLAFVSRSLLQEKRDKTGDTLVAASPTA